jgi:hypothetical protein
MPIVFSALLRAYSVLACEHLDKCVTLVLIDDTGLDGAKAGEDTSELLLRTSIKERVSTGRYNKTAKENEYSRNAAYEKGTAENLDVAIR